MVGHKNIGASFAGGKIQIFLHGKKHTDAYDTKQVLHNRCMLNNHMTGYQKGQDFQNGIRAWVAQKLQKLNSDQDIKNISDKIQESDAQPNP